MKEIRYYINLVESGEPTNPGRRGFFKKVGAGAAVAQAISLDPTGTIVKGLVKDLGLKNLSVLDQLLQVATPRIVLGFFKLNRHHQHYEGALSGDEINDAARRLKIDPDRVEQWMDQQDWQGLDGLNSLRAVLGRPLTFDHITQVLDKNGIDYEYDEWSDEILTLEKALRKLVYDQDVGKNPNTQSSPTSTVKNISQSTTASNSDSLIPSLVRSALVMAKKFIKNTPPTPDPAATPTNITPNQPIALPAPKKSEYDDLFNPNVSQEKPEFDFWEPKKDDEQTPKSKKI
jgi:hypothetical protein